MLRRVGFARVVGVGQWVAIPVLPVWLFAGHLLVSGAGWEFFALLLVGPALLVLLIIGPVISLGSRRSESRAVDVYRGVTLALWAVLIVLPLSLEAVGDSNREPSLFELLGVSDDANTVITAALLFATVLLLAASWVAATTAAVIAGRASRATGTAALRSPA